MRIYKASYRKTVFHPAVCNGVPACKTAAGQRNRNHTGPFVRFKNVSFAMEEVLFDPQTSGGLLLAVDPADAAALEQALRAAGLSASIVGEILPKQKIEITVTDK